MRKLSFILLLWAGIFRLYGQDIAARLDSLVSASALLQTSEVGISVFNLTKGEPVYAYQDRKLYRPASVEKVITSVTALARLGEAYTFDTRLAYTGTLDAFLIGGFDPEFMEDDLDDLVGAVLRAGIRTVEGKLVADVSVMDSVYWGSGWAWDDAQYSFQPYLSPLMLNRGCVSVSVKPTQRGHRPEVETVPESDYYAIDNRAVCHIPHCGRLRIERDWMHNDNTIHITGNANRACGQLLSMFSSQDFFLHTFAYKLRQKHIGLNSLAYGVCPEEGTYIYKVSRPLEEVKEPDNYNIVDGSGVSMYNYISPDLLVAYLKYAYTHKEIFEPFYEALPIAGVDGTLRYRMRKSNVFRNVHAKTGTVKGVSSLAGYVRSAEGDLLAFAIINQNVLSGRKARLFQDKVCEILAQ